MVLSLYEGNNPACNTAGGKMTEASCLFIPHLFAEPLREKMIKLDIEIAILKWRLVIETAKEELRKDEA